MALDTTAQKTKMYKRAHLRNVKYGIMTGDSIANGFATETNKSNYLFRDSIGHYLFNKAVGGTDIANYVGVDDDVWNPFSFVSRSEVGATNIFNVTNTDYLINWAGFNDKNDHIPLGAIDSDDPFTIAGAIRTGVANYRARNPDIQIFFITPNSNSGQTPNDIDLNLVDYRNHIIAVCATINVPCYDLYAQGDPVFTDGIHPDAASQEAWVPLFVDFVLQNLD